MAAIDVSNRFAEQDKATEVNVVAVVKGKSKPREYWIFLYDDANRTEILRQAGRWASNPELAFTWYDCAVAAEKIRGEEKGA